MNILLNGYFDKNLGDDIMQKMVVEALPEHKFYINCREREMLSHLENYTNVYINEPCPKTDLFLNVIGTGFMYSGKRAKAEKLINIFTAKKTHYPKSALINCSLESFDSHMERYFANLDLKDYNLITCRDGISYDYLSQNFKNASIKQFPDMVFSSGLQKLACKNEGLLGVAPVRRLYSGDNYAYYKELALFCDNYIEKYDKNVLLFAFDNGLENDVSAVSSVRAMMKKGNRAKIIIYGGNPDETVKNIGRCELFVGSRFHSIVLARLLNVKCAAIYDKGKLKRLCKDERIPSVSKTDFTAEKLSEYIKNCECTQQSYLESKGHIDVLREFISK